MAVKRLKNKKKNKKPLWIKIIIAFMALIIIDIFWYLFVIDIEQYKNSNPDKTAFMKFREKQWAEKERKMKIKKVWVPLSRISKNAQRAVIVSEDAKFWTHEGFDFDAMRMAVEKNLKKRKMAVGASTISMQVAKNLYLSPAKNPVRKINEAIITWRMERTLSKKRILEIYLNIAEWGDGIFGIEAASRHYFNHPAASLNVHESALLASVLPNPVKYSPLKNSRFVYRRSRLIQNVLGGDINAASELHRKKITSDNNEEDTLKDTNEKNGSANVMTNDSIMTKQINDMDSARKNESNSKDTNKDTAEL